MKGSTIWAGLLFLPSLIILAGGVQAQAPYALQGNIPFSFTVGNDSLPSGDYLFKTYDQWHLLIRSLNGGKIVCVPTFTNTKVVFPKVQAGGQIVFHVYDGVYFLSKVVNYSEYYDRQLPVTKSEKESRKSSIVPQIKTIAALTAQSR